MYRLFQRIPKGLDPVAELFRKHVESEGMQRVKEATETAAAKKEKDAGALFSRRLASSISQYNIHTCVHTRALSHDLHVAGDTGLRLGIMLGPSHEA